MAERNMSVTLEIIQGDLSEVDADVIALKHANERLFGVEASIDEKLNGLLSATYADSPLQRQGEAVLIPCYGLGARSILIVGVGSLYEMTYKSIDELARNSVTALATYLPTAESLATTIHGPGIGLDATECLKAQVLGFASALRRMKKPLSVRRILIVARDSDLVEELAAGLSEFNRDHPDVLVKRNNLYLLTARHSSGKLEQFRYEALHEPTIFVAMPFGKKFRNIYYYGIRLPIRNIDRKPIRMDDEQFTGSIIAQVKEQISSSEIVIADMTGANPNVFFEVGFAEGAGKRTVLLCQDPKELPFDVRGDVHVVYDPDNIPELEERLTERLKTICM